jgi:Siphovirus Gp157
MAAIATIPASQKLTLVDLNLEIDVLLDSMDMIPETEPDLLKAAQADLAALVARRMNKVDGVHRVILNYKHKAAIADREAELLEEEAGRIRGRSAASLNRAQRLESYVILAMESQGKNKLEGDTVNVSRYSAQGSVEIFNEEMVPAQFKTATITEKVNKKDVAAAIKSNQEVPGARLLPGKQCLRWS